MLEETATASSATKTESMDEGTAASSSATAADGAGVDVLEEASKLIGTGNKNLVMGDVPAAVNAFQEACGMLAQKYGDTADECAEAFFLCGKSLLELARVENGVLGNALEGVPEEEEEVGEEEKKEDSKIESADNLDEKTRDELREQVYDAMAEKQGEDKTEEKTEEKSESSDKAEEDKTITPTKEENKRKSPAKEGEGKTSPKKEKGKTPEKEEQEKEEGKEAEDKSEKESSEPDKGDDSKEAKALQSEPVEDGETGATEETAAEEAMQEGEDGEEGDEEEGEGEATAEDEKESEEEEVGNLQLAWEMLEIAKVIYKRKESKEDQLFAAQAHLKLGEISVESGNYPQATEDFQECLAIQKKHLEPHSRLLAETHYQLGLVFGYINQYGKAIEHFNHSVEVIESRLAMLKEVIDKAESDENVSEDKKEMEEIKLLLPDIREKIEDAKEGQKTGKVASAAILETLTGGSTSGFSGENSGTSASTIPVKAAEVASSSKSVSDISHLIRKKRKPEEESPTKDKDAKKAKPNTSVNGSGDTATNGNAVEDKKEPAKPAGAAMETSV
ncbi:histone-binding protein N1/N2-like isoform X3 [Acipenser oxyrinchus oxyrinchus]|uniref:Histone-binding protein N1/N2-like isoform X3 n=1 Tax=Acipenser oxyrinchus oxyrinchus TaxID=40147 RepID=A0AAD8G5Z1_ACIOX|nr:histone-binding protein N1/N2-like isoform X3 [Acipenser oxyrinchus oxyrinchus]